MIEIKSIPLSLITPYIKQTQREGMAGYATKANYYGVYNDGTLVGFTSIEWFSEKVKFNNHYVFPEHRGKGYFKAMFDFSINEVKKRLTGANRIKYIEAACTKMSINHYLKMGAIKRKEYAIATHVFIPTSRL